MTAATLKDAEARMNKSVAATRDEFSRLRTGRASPVLVERLMVNYYDNPTPLPQVAGIAVADARTLTIQPWEKHMVPVIEKAILESDLGLTPMSAGDVIRLRFPLMTEERRGELGKLVRQGGEQGRVAVRNIRRDALQHLREAHKSKTLSEDELKQAEGDLQTLTDKYIKQIDESVAQKEREVMEV